MVPIAAAFNPCLHLFSKTKTQIRKVAARLYLSLQRVTFTAGHNKGAPPPQGTLSHMSSVKSVPRRAF